MGASKKKIRIKQNIFENKNGKLLERQVGTKVGIKIWYEKIMRNRNVWEWEYKTQELRAQHGEKKKNSNIVRSN